MVLRAGLVSRRRARHVLSVVSALLLLNASLRLARGRDLAPELLQLAFLPRLLDAVIALLRLLQFAFELMLAPSLSLVLDLLLALHQPLAGVEAYDRAARRLMGRPIIDRAFCRRCGAEVLRLHSDANDCEKRRGCEFRDHSDFPGVHCTGLEATHVRIACSAGNRLQAGEIGPTRADRDRLAIGARFAASADLLKSGYFAFWQGKASWRASSTSHAAEY
jgi:hypothetical protein